MPPTPELRAAILADATTSFTKLRSAAEDAMAQVDDRGFFAPLGPDDNSIAVLVKHVGGNLRSRFSDFLESDGEKPHRDRDSEFEVDPAREDRASLMAAWQLGWETVLATLGSLSPADVEREVRIRGQPLTVREALDRAALHVAGHVGQIVLLAKHHAGAGWRTLSIPRARRSAR